MSVWFPIWNQLLESMGYALSFCWQWKASGVVNTENSETLDNRLMLHEPHQPFWGRAAAAQSRPISKRAALLSPHGEEACQAPRTGDREGFFWAMRDLRVEEMTVDALQSWLHPDTWSLVLYCSQTVNIQCQVVLCCVTLLCYTVLC